jgi:LPS export ABC transporter protein LptC
VALTFFDDDLNVTSTLTAGYAVSREQDQVMEARQNVVVVNSRGDRLNTEHLVWDEKTRRIHSDAFSRITTATEVIYGNGMEANEEFTRYRIKDVKGVLKRQGHAADS